MSPKEELRRGLKQIRDSFLAKRMQQLDVKESNPNLWKELEAECTALANEHQLKTQEYDALPSEN